MIDEERIMKDYYCIYNEVYIGRNVTIQPFAVIGKPPQAPSGTRAREITVDRPTHIGHNCVISSHAVIYQGCSIGNNVLIGDGVRIRENVTVGDNCIVGMNTKIGPNTIIQDRVKIMDLCNIAADMLIENDVFVSQGTMCTNDKYMGRSVPTNKGPTIKKFTTVGAGAIILPAVEIGENCIIGAGALITKDVPDRVVMMSPRAQEVRKVRDDELKV